RKLQVQLPNARPQFPGARDLAPARRCGSAGGRALDEMNSSPQPMSLGIPGFSYADLYQPLRLRELHDVFSGRVAADDPELWQRWEAYRNAPESVTSPIERSDLIVRMSRHVSRFLVDL